jgi:hypothetical protein
MTAGDVAIAELPAVIDRRYSSEFPNMNRLLAVAFILFCFEIGLFLVFVPWSQLWEHNVLLTYSVYLRSFLLNNFVRGAVSGLGVVDVMLGLTELAHFWKSFKIVNRTTAE